MRPPGSSKSLEQRRRRAVALLKRGLSMTEVAERVGTSVASVCRWKQAATAGGPAALAAKPVPGRPSKLTAAPCRRLVKLLAKGATAYGHPDERWTLRRIAKMIKREFGVEYHPNHIGRLLKRCGWAGQVLRRRAGQGEKPV